VGAVIGFLLALGVVLLVAQNTEPVAVEWLGWEATISLAALLLATALLASASTAILGVIWRQRRRRAMSERSELEQLRAGVHEPGGPIGSRRRSGPAGLGG